MDYLRWRRARAGHCARRCAEAYERTGHPLFRVLHGIHLEDVDELNAELADVGDR